MNPSGQARLEVEVIDLSVLINTGLKGVIGVLGITEKGPIGSTILIGSWADFVANFGGLLSYSLFPLICRRALEGGAKLKISRAAHYSDITDRTTVVGSKASGAITTGLNVLTFEALSIGAQGNGIKITTAAAANGNANEFDVTIDIAGQPQLQQVYKNLKKNPTLPQIDAFNNAVSFFKITTLVGDVTIGTVTLSGGLQDWTLITDVDYIGDAIAETGIHAFDKDFDITKICVPEMALPTIDMALANYADMRKDLMAIVRTPVGVTGDIAVQYREGNGIYSHPAIDTWRAMMFTGGLKVTDPYDNVVKFIPELGDICGLISTKDNKQNEWFSFSGPKRGRIKNALGVAYNFGTPARQTQGDLVDVRGINQVIDHPDFGVISWGNSTLQKADTLLKHANVAELIIFLTRSLKPLIQSELFDPNDIETWKNIYRRVKPLLDFIKEGRGMWDYLYQGDQDIDNISDAVVNQPSNIDAGQYILHIFVKPKVAMKYVGVKVAITNSGVDFTELLTQPL